jgi:hypothetical protein
VIEEGAQQKKQKKHNERQEYTVSFGFKHVISKHALQHIFQECDLNRLFDFKQAHTFLHFVLPLLHFLGKRRIHESTHTQGAQSTENKPSAGPLRCFKHMDILFFLCNKQRAIHEVIFLLG